MARVLIVYDSVFGNTEQVARAIGRRFGSAPDGTRAGEEVEIVRVPDAKPEHLAGLKFLIVGSPTRAFRPTPAITGFLKRIPPDSLRGVKLAAFDTRISPEDVKPAVVRAMVKLFGYAAESIATRLGQKGGESTVLHEGFFVNGTEGPLKDMTIRFTHHDLCCRINAC